MNKEKYLMTEDNQYVDIDTGEIIPKDVLIGILQSEQKEVFDKNNADILEIGGEVSSNIRVSNKDYNVIQIKKNYQFNKIFRVEVRKIMIDNKLSIPSRATIATLEGFIVFPDNCVVINGETPTYEKLQEVIGIKRSNLYKVLKELENNDIIKRKTKSGRVTIYFNPFLYCSGKVVSKTTYDLFKNSIYNK